MSGLLVQLPDRPEPHRFAGDPTQRSAYRFVCCECGRETFIVRPQIKYSTADSEPAALGRLITRKLEAAGWSILKHGRKVACPEHSPKKEPKEMSTTTKPNGAMPLPPAATAPPLIAASPAGVRMPARADNQLIAGELDLHYDTKRGLYLKAASDDSIAKELDVPRAWVTALRVQLYGDGADNEAGAAKVAEIVAMEKRLAELETRTLADLDGFRREIETMKRRR